MSAFHKIEKLIKENEIKFLDLRFSDTIGKEHHVTLPVSAVSEDLFKIGQPFDGSSIEGWKGIEASDMLLRPDVSTVRFDPFFDDATLFVTCDVIEPSTMESYDRCPRGIAKKAEKFIKESGLADTAYFGPEPEFFIFDSVTWGADMSGCHYKINADEAAWSSDKEIDGGNTGHRPGIKGGYFPLPPMDSHQDLRSAACLALEELGIPVEVHHHEVATAGQCEIGTKFSSLVERADWSQIFKYVLRNTAHRYGKTVTFMPKPIVGDNGSGMHVHQSIWKDGKNLFAGKEYANLSETALHYIGGIIKHSKALNAITNPSTNSYKRLVPGFEAPVIMTYSARNRSAAIRIPFSASEKGRRLEARFPDPLANPYLAFSALLMAGIDGIINKIDPGKAMDINLYELPEDELALIPQVCSNFEMALDHLNKDRAFLTRGGVFSDEWIDSYIKLKMHEVTKLHMTTHPVEMQMYYSL
ncbi:MAG: type I glutamate--ammonia ligase [Burkholderiales bacterium]|nr:type I glutamate--ammonia ligase [Burkholderiales bacterium]